MTVFFVVVLPVWLLHAALCEVYGHLAPVFEAMFSVVVFWLRCTTVIMVTWPFLVVLDALSVLAHLFVCVLCTRSSTRDGQCVGRCGRVLASLYIDGLARG